MTNYMMTQHSKLYSFTTLVKKACVLHRTPLVLGRMISSNQMFTDTLPLQYAINHRGQLCPDTPPWISAVSAGANRHTTRTLAPYP